MNVYCNLRCCDECRKKVSISVNMPFQAGISTNNMYCLAHIAEAVSRNIHKNITINLAGGSLANREMGEAELEEGSVGVGNGVPCKEAEKVDDEGVRDTETTTEISFDTEDVVGQVFGG